MLNTVPPWDTMCKSIRCTKGTSCTPCRCRPGDSAPTTASAAQHSAAHSEPCVLRYVGLVGIEEHFTSSAATAFTLSTRGNGGRRRRAEDGNRRAAASSVTGRSRYSRVLQVVRCRLNLVCAARCILHTYCSFDRSGPFTVQPCARHRVKARMDHAARRHELRTPVQCAACVSSLVFWAVRVRAWNSAAQRSAWQGRPRPSAPTRVPAPPAAAGRSLRRSSPRTRRSATAAAASAR